MNDLFYFFIVCMFYNVSGLHASRGSTSGCRCLLQRALFVHISAPMGRIVCRARGPHRLLGKDVPPLVLPAHHSGIPVHDVAAPFVARRNGQLSSGPRDMVSVAASVRLGLILEAHGFSLHLG